RSYIDPDDRLKTFRAHPQTLAYMLTPAKLARLGAGASPPGKLVVIEDDDIIHERRHPCDVRVTRG
ncbi:MAG: hypothetical protein ABGY41_08905, partial [Candidatus Poribacteria bacterium]